MAFLQWKIKIHHKDFKENFFFTVSMSSSKEDASVSDLFSRLSVHPKLYSYSLQFYRKTYINLGFKSAKN